MGEFVKHPETGEEIKIGCMDEAFFSRSALVGLKEKGFKGFYANEYDVEAGRKDSLDLMLNDPRTLYPLPEGCRFNPEIHVVKIANEGIEHDTVTLQQHGNRGSVYTWTGLPCLQKTAPEIYAVLVGERYDEEGRARSIFRCDCCGQPFSISHEEAFRLKEAFQCWKQWIIPNPALEK